MDVEPKRTEMAVEQEPLSERAVEADQRGIQVRRLVSYLASSESPGECGPMQGMTDQEFAEALDRYLHPSSPIKQHEFLRGRAKQLQAIQDALASSGRSVFIYGDRGVGKTSLALSAATVYQSSDSDPTLVGCSRDATFYSVVRDLAARLLGEVPIKERRRVVKQVGATFRGLSASVLEEIESGNLEPPTSVNEAVALLDFAGRVNSKHPIAIIDEFERIEDPRQRALFGDLLKQIGDQGAGLKLIFSGVGQSLQEMLAEHDSAYRYVASVSLERLGHGPLLEILQGAADALGMKPDRNHTMRIVQISDGFPHYVHLIGTKLFLRIYRSGLAGRENAAAMYNGALLDAVADVDARLQTSYDKAVKKYLHDHYSYILWAVASRHLLELKSADVYDCYLKIAERAHVEALPRNRFNQRMNRLKTERHGCVLAGTRTGWYRFREPVLRGYCRLQAETQSINLGYDYPFVSTK